MPDLLRTDHLTVCYGRRSALRDVSLHLKDQGHIVGLFGQNGAGKSTLIRVLCGQIARFTGTITMPDRIGYLPDAFFLYDFLTIRQSMTLAAALFDDFDPTVAREIFTALQLRESMRVGQASKGMREQIHLALILARRCPLYIFDEPLAAVDPLTRDRLIDLIRCYRTPGSTVILSTHLISGLEDLFDEALVIHDGALVAHENTRTLAPQGGLEALVKEMIATHALAR